MYKLRRSQQVDVSVHLKKEEHWPSFASLEKSDQIVSLHLQGEFNPIKILFILENFQNLQELTLSNINESLCNKHIVYKQNTTITLGGLLSLRMINLGACPNLYKLLSKNVRFPGLKMFQMEKGVIDSSNVKEVRKLLISAKLSLQILIFSMTSWNTNLNFNMQDVFSNVTTIQMDFVTTESNKTVNYIQDGFSILFPSLTSFFIE